MAINPLTGLEEDEINPQSAPSEINPLVKDYLMKKFNLGQFTDENRQQLVNENQPTLGDKAQAAIASIGAGFSGRDAASAGQSMLASQKAARDEKLNAFDKGRANKIQDFSLEREATKAEREDKEFTLSQEKLNREKDPSSAESQLAKQLAQRMGYKGDTANLTAEQFKQFSPALQKMYEIEEKSKDRADARAERYALFGEKKNERDEAKAQKRKDLEDTLAVPGYERTGEVLPKPEEAAKLRKATANAEQLGSKLKRLKELVKDEGSFEYGGKSGAEMESLATEIQLLAKGEDMYQLGVLTGPDMKLLEKITADPSSLNSLFTRDSTRMKQIDTQLKSIEDKLSSVTKASGYAPKGTSNQPAAPAKVKVSNGEETLMIDASDLSDAENDGYKQVQ